MRSDSMPPPSAAPTTQLRSLQQDLASKDKELHNRMRALDEAECKVR